jgi:hypothetical protein
MVIANNSDLDRACDGVCLAVDYLDVCIIFDFVNLPLTFNFLSVNPSYPFPSGKALLEGGRKMGLKRDDNRKPRRLISICRQWQMKVKALAGQYDKKRHVSPAEMATVLTNRLDACFFPSSEGTVI